MLHNKSQVAHRKKIHQVTRPRIFSFLFVFFRKPYFNSNETESHNKHSESSSFLRHIRTVTPFITFLLKLHTSWHSELQLILFPLPALQHNAPCLTHLYSITLGLVVFDKPVLSAIFEQHNKLITFIMVEVLCFGLIPLAGTY